jgi:hypothetical protein
MILDLLANSSADFFERLLSRDVGNTGTGSIQSVDSKIGSENDQGFRKIDSIAAAEKSIRHRQALAETCREFWDGLSQFRRRAPR